MNIVLAFVTKNWKFIAIGALVLSLFIGYKYHQKVNERLEKEIIDMKLKIAMQDEAIKSRDKIIVIQEKTIEIARHYEQEEKESEHHYHEKVVNNKTIVKEYVEKENKTKEDVEKHYTWLNESWSGVDDVLKWYEKPKK